MQRLGWRARSVRHAPLHSYRSSFARRYAAQQPPASNPAATSSRVSRIESRLPRFLRRFVAPLRDAPISHISAFIILHEITAVVPLFGLAGVFLYTNWLPPYISEGKWVSDGTEKFGKWMRKKGWIGDDNARGRWWGRGEAGVRVVSALATSYAVTKALLPFRLVLSVWATPWFARWTVLPFTNRVARLFRRKQPTQSKGVDAGATGAVSGGAIPPKQAK